MTDLQAAPATSDATRNDWRMVRAGAASREHGLRPLKTFKKGVKPTGSPRPESRQSKGSPDEGVSREAAAAGISVGGDGGDTASGGSSLAGAEASASLGFPIPPLSFSFAAISPSPSASASTPAAPCPSSLAPAPPSSSTPYADLNLLAALPNISFKPGEDLSDFFESLDAEIGYWESNFGGSNGSPCGTPGDGSDLHHSERASKVDIYASGFTRSITAADVNGQAGSPSSAALPSLQDRARYTGGDNVFNDGFFRSLPKPVRDVVCQKVFNVVTSSELSRNAGMAMVMLYRLRMQQQQQQQQDVTDPAEAAAVTLQQARLLAQSNTYFQRALEHIQLLLIGSTVNSLAHLLLELLTPIPFEAKMVAVLDMQTYQFDQWGAAAANAIVLLGEYFVVEELGPQYVCCLSLSSEPLLDSQLHFPLCRPPLDLTTASPLLSTFAWTDAVRCICIPGRRTVFTFSNMPGDPSPTSPGTVLTDVSSSASDIQVHLGLPVGLMLCIAAIANFAFEMDALPEEVVKVKAEAIEKAVRGWRPPVPDVQELADGTTFVEKVSTAEMWRHAIIIFLYQTVHGHACLSRVMREAMQQILQLGSRMLTAYRSSVCSIVASPSLTGLESSKPPAPQEDYLSVPATRAVPWFLAGTVATLPQDRALCKRGLEACGPLKGYADNISALERIWEATDEKGWTVEWKALLQTEKRFVGFL
ncbi:SPOSA6832_05123 [Sporobolomyces salmonicolor]|uniref:SPOSA6832_05123-mRNA-1:cds n=1 Tax=Sporidiobolus salmonicolor TaxID=5005 RepID=A0A0D6ETX0_SPOSA|nr:SPOSA6832_05123 [Sporobolomyces salmonicolor]